MSHALIARNLDLKHLAESGYTIRFLDGYLLIQDVPYVTSVGEISEATLAMQLDLSGERTSQPGDHVAYWTGEFPYGGDSQKLEVLGESTHDQFLSNGLRLTYMFSAKPEGGRYRDYEHKVRTYIEIITREARKLTRLHRRRSGKSRNPKAIRVFLRLWKQLQPVKIPQI